MLHHGDGYQLLQRYLLRLLDGVYNKVYTIYLFSIWVQEEDSPSIQRILHFFSETTFTSFLWFSNVLKHIKFKDFQVFDFALFYCVVFQDFYVLERHKEACC